MMRAVLVIGASHSTVLTALLAGQRLTCEIVCIDSVERFHPPEKTLEEKVSELKNLAPAFPATNKPFVSKDEFLRPQPFYRGLRKYRKWDR